MRIRKTISAPRREFLLEIRRLENLDSKNQTSEGISSLQLHQLTEFIFFSAFRLYQEFIRDIFLLYCMEKQPSTRKLVRSFLKPKDFNHAEFLIQSSMPFLDWASPDTVINRSELYLKNGFPIKLPYTANLNRLRDLKHIRNHIAHNSKESVIQYKKIVKNHFRTLPVTLPSPGEFLLLSERKKTGKYNLLTYFDLMKQMAIDLT